MKSAADALLKLAVAAIAVAVGAQMFAAVASRLVPAVGPLVILGAIGYWLVGGARSRH